MPEMVMFRLDASLPCSLNSAFELDDDVVDEAAAAVAVEEGEGEEKEEEDDEEEEVEVG